jgi:serine/threonine-protein kinase
LSQLEVLNEAVASSRHPQLPALEQDETSQEYTASPGSVPTRENLPGQEEVAPDDTGLPAVGRYEILARLKRGGMGSVYMCRLSGSAGFRRLFAMKVLHGHLAQQADTLSAFFNEARVLGGLHHRNIVGIADVGSESEPYIVLDYVEGGSLAEVFRATRSGRDPSLVVRVIMDALCGLTEAHEACDESGQPMSLVHCDVTPHNLLVGVDGTCRVTDFGIARTVQVDVKREVTRGKPGYLAPERLERTGCDQRADIFSLGVVLYAGLTGVEPFAGESAQATMRNVLERSPTPPSEVGMRPPPSLDWVCMKALSRDPRERFQSADEMAEQLRRIAERENLIASSSEVSDWVQESLAPTLEARRTASLRGTSTPESRFQPSSIPPAAELLSPDFEAPSAAEHTGPLEPPASSRAFQDKTEVLSSYPPVQQQGGRPSLPVTDAADEAVKQPLALYVILALAMAVLVWTVMQPDGVSSVVFPKDAAKGSTEQPAGAVLPKVAPAQETP